MVVDSEMKATHKFPYGSASRAVREAGFTLIEVLAMAIVIGVGLMSIMAVVMFALSKQLEAQAACTAMPTAVSAANDPRPLLPNETAADWNVATISPGSSGSASAITKGWLNGYWVEREERSEAEDVLGEWTPVGGAWTVTPGGARSLRVTVRVYENSATSSRQVGFFTTRMIRQAP